MPFFFFVLREKLGICHTITVSVPNIKYVAYVTHVLLGYVQFVAYDYAGNFLPAAYFCKRVFFSFIVKP